MEATDEPERVDRRIIADAAGGDVMAFTALLTAHEPGLRRRLEPGIPRRWRALVSADDVLQQTFADAFRDIGRLVSHEPRTFGAWLAAIARHNLLNAIELLESRKRGGDRRRVESWDTGRSTVAFARDATGRGSDGAGGTPSANAVRDEAVGALCAAVAALPPPYRRVIEHCDLGGRSVDEVAAQLGRTSGAVSMLRARAHRLLASRLRELVGDFSAG